MSDIRKWIMGAALIIGAASGILMIKKLSQGDNILAEILIILTMIMLIAAMIISLN